MTVREIGPEEQLARQILDLAALTGWRVFRVENSTRVIRRPGGAHVRVRNVNAQGVGYPDLTLVHAKRRRLIFVELKRDLGPRGGAQHNDSATSPEQQVWLADLEAVAAAVAPDPVTLPPGAPIGPGAVTVHVWRPSDWPEIERTLTGA